LVEAKDIGEALRATDPGWEGCVTAVDVGALVTHTRAAILDAARRPLTQQESDHIEGFFVMIRQLARLRDPKRAQMIEYLRAAIAADRSFSATMKDELRARIAKDRAFDDQTTAEMLSLVVAGAAEAEGPPLTSPRRGRRKSGAKWCGWRCINADPLSVRSVHRHSPCHRTALSGG
jgi:hypothetical protein